MKCTVCNEILSTYEPYEIIDNERVHVKCYEKEQSKMFETDYLCSNCKWKVAANWDKEDKFYRCSDCDSELEGYEGV